MFKKKDDMKNNEKCKDENLEGKDVKEELKNNEESHEENLETSNEDENPSNNENEEGSNESQDTNSSDDSVENIGDLKLIKDLKSENEKLKGENEKLKDESKKLKNEFEALKDRLARTVAEYDNFRKRTAKEKENIYTDACGDVLKEILPVLDNLERAISADGSADDLKKGVKMTMNIFNDAFKKLGVEEIPTDGEFDPHLHNAVMHIEDENYDKNCIAEVFQKGYRRGDKVIRYSMVKVAN
jgi:molecular chaperone GrpE